jgi:molybdopterin-synthase adenylyltransferase
MVFEFDKQPRDKKNNPRERYSRQTMFPAIGEEGQNKISSGKVVIIGCGALGSHVANLLVRAGVGKVKIIDRDFIEFHNLQRQVLFDEDDIRKQFPKAIAARKHLEKANSLIEIEGIVADVNAGNAEEFCKGMDVILDGLDNMESRFLINDVSQKLKIPYVYGGAVSATGMTTTFIPGKTPCLRCITPRLPASKDMATCETAGVIGPIPAVIAALEAAEALKILVGSKDYNDQLLTIDIWNTAYDLVKLNKKENCPACNGNYEYLVKKSGIVTASLCGQTRAVQVLNTSIKKLNLHEVAITLPDVSNLFQNEYMLRFDSDEYQFIIFPDGRAIIKNTTDESLARVLYQKYVRSPEEEAESNN